MPGLAHPPTAAPAMVNSEHSQHTRIPHHTHQTRQSFPVQLWLPFLFHSSIPPTLLGRSSPKSIHLLCTVISTAWALHTIITWAIDQRSFCSNSPTAQTLARQRTVDLGDPAALTTDTYHGTRSCFEQAGHFTVRNLQYNVLLGRFL
jgi:hypothetical protein